MHRSDALEVIFTIDVEIWCDGWRDIDDKFPSALERYLYGPHRQGGLPTQLQVLNDHGLRSVCFVEPLFAGRFGQAPLSEIVGVIMAAGHEIQLHLHTEWVDESRTALLPGSPAAKRQHLRYFTRAEQASLIGLGMQWLQQAGAPRPTAFRAGSFAFNSETFPALVANGIEIDCSYNASMMGLSSGVAAGEMLLQARRFGGVLEVPMTVYLDGCGLRHVQLTACSWREMEGLLWRALEAGFRQFVILSHNFELLTPGLRGVDRMVVRRLEQLCRFLDLHRGDFRVRGLSEATLAAEDTVWRPLKSPLWRTGMRMIEQTHRQLLA